MHSSAVTAGCCNGEDKEAYKLLLTAKRKKYECNIAKILNHHKYRSKRQIFVWNSSQRFFFPLLLFLDLHIPLPLARSFASYFIQFCEFFFRLKWIEIYLQKAFGWRDDDDDEEPDASMMILTLSALLKKIGAIELVLGDDHNRVLYSFSSFCLLQKILHPPSSLACACLHNFEVNVVT
jgi:hypothetical protein